MITPSAARPDGHVASRSGTGLRAGGALETAFINGDAFLNQAVAVGHDGVMTTAFVIAVSRDDEHRFSKPRRESISLVAGLGVEGDAHFGATVQHLSRVRRDPTQPDLRQVHLIQRELFEDVTAEIAPGELGENVTTEGVDLLRLPRGTRLRLGAECCRSDRAA